MPRKKPIFRVAPIPHLAEQYASGRSMVWLAQENGCSATTVRLQLVRLGVARRPAGSGNRAQRVPVIPGVAEEYQRGKTLLQIGREHGCSLSTVRNQLLALGVNPRPNRKLTDEQRKYVLTQDERDVPHIQIAAQVGLTRERIRQICQAAGHPTRRSRMHPFKAPLVETGTMLGSPGGGGH